MITFNNIPECKYKMDKNLMDELCDYNDSLSIEEILLGWINSDCWSCVSKYKCYSELVVEFNSFYLEDEEKEYIFNIEHPNYFWSINKILGNRNRKYISEYPTEYLDKIEYCYIYQGDETMMKLSKIGNKWNREYYYSDLIKDKINKNKNYWQDRIERVKNFQKLCIND